MATEKQSEMTRADGTPSRRKRGQTSHDDFNDVQVGGGCCFASSCFSVSFSRRSEVTEGVENKQQRSNKAKL